MRTSPLPPASRRGVATTVATEGEFAGWRTFNDDGFETHIGALWYRQEPDDSMRCAFRVEKKHTRDTGQVHGGCLMTFADYCLHVIAKPVMEEHGVTINFAGDFIDAAREGDLIIGTGEVIRAGGSLIFVRGQLTVAERTLFTFSGTIKRLRPQRPEA
ncbi:PaaI family thioesterase [Kribbella sp. NPDC050820]|uniref:PaaI family thioesterase n=1 Tax=Kribbella sp. NPDC050820 TaxID=3155408 RepID=UPI0033DC7AEC